MHFYENERIALFVDGADLYATTRALNFELDYKRLLMLFRQRAQLMRAIYFTTLIDHPEGSPLQPLIDWLTYNGFTVVTKHVKDRIDGGKSGVSKRSIAVELTVRAMQLAQGLDHIVLFSGNGDLRCLIAALQQIGKRVSIVSTLRSQPPMAADALRRQADQFIDLADLIQIVGSENSTQPNRQPRAKSARTTPP